MTGRITRRRLMQAGLVVAGASAAAPALAGTASAGPASSGTVSAGTATAPAISLAPAPTLPWPAANDIVAATKLPSFPDATFDVTGYGAKGDGKADNTAAFKKAIDACNAAGGGHVVVPSGTYVTGAVYLKSNVDLHLDTGATLKFSGDASKFPTVLTRYEGTCWRRR